MIAVAESETHASTPDNGDAATLIADAEKAVAAAGKPEPELTAREIGHRAALAKIEAAGAALDAALDLTYPSIWDYVAAKYEAAIAASDVCDDVYPDAVLDDDAKILAASQPITDVLHNAIDDLTETDAPDWPGLALKARALVAQYGAERDCRWVRAATSFIAAADALGTGAREDLDFFDVLHARVHVEKMAYHMAHDRSGYAGWACFGGGAIAKASALVETIVRESREFARAAPAQEAMSKAVLGAVWNGIIPSLKGVPAEAPPVKPAECEVDTASDTFANALRIHLSYERQPMGQVDAEGRAKSTAAAAEMDEAAEEAMRTIPTSRSGVAFQLLVACGALDMVRAGNTEASQEEAEEKVRAAIVNAINVLGLPFDYETATFYVGRALDGNDGMNRPGPAR